jgi:DNA-binding NtrC family response regulator
MSINIYTINDNQIYELLTFVLNSTVYSISQLSNLNELKDVATCGIALVPIGAIHIEPITMQIPIVYIIQHKDLVYASKAFSIGKINFIETPFKTTDLIDIINNVLDNDKLQVCINKLTYKEQEVLSNLRTGDSHKKIAKIMDISFRTVESHIFNIKNKTQSDINTVIQYSNIKKYYQKLSSNY